MMATQKNTTKKMTANERYVRTLYDTVKNREAFDLTGNNARFSDTQLRMLAEIARASQEGKRLISTQLAKRLGVTRSAISQIVSELEREGVVKRVADDVDRKIAYIEFTEKTAALYEEDWNACVQFVGKVVKKFGEEKFYQMCALSNEFADLFKEEKRLAQSKKK